MDQQQSEQAKQAIDLVLKKYGNKLSDAEKSMLNKATSAAEVSLIADSCIEDYDVDTASSINSGAYTQEGVNQDTRSAIQELVASEPVNKDNEVAHAAFMISDVDKGRYGDNFDAGIYLHYGQMGSLDEVISTRKERLEGVVSPENDELIGHLNQMNGQAADPEWAEAYGQHMSQMNDAFVANQASSSAKKILGDANNDGTLTRSEALAYFDKNRDGHITEKELGGLNGLVGETRTVPQGSAVYLGGVKVESQSSLDVSRFTTDYNQLRASSNPEDKKKADDLDAFFNLMKNGTPEEIQNFSDAVLLTQYLKTKAGKNATTPVDGNTDPEWNAAINMTGPEREQALKEAHQLQSMGMGQTSQIGYTGAGLQTQNEVQAQSDREEIDMLRKKRGPTGAGGSATTDKTSKPQITLSADRADELAQRESANKAANAAQAQSDADEKQWALEQQRKGLQAASTAAKEKETRDAQYAASMSAQNDAFVAQQAATQKAANAAQAQSDADEKQWALEQQRKGLQAASTAAKEKETRDAQYAASMSAQNDAFVAQQAATQKAANAAQAQSDREEIQMLRNRQPIVAAPKKPVVATQAQSDREEIQMLRNRQPIVAAPKKPVVLGGSTSPAKPGNDTIWPPVVTPKLSTEPVRTGTRTTMGMM